jgi:hypothetical protein
MFEEWEGAKIKQLIFKTVTQFRKIVALFTL